MFNASFVNGTNASFVNGTNVTFANGTNVTFTNGTNVTFANATTHQQYALNWSPIALFNIGNACASFLGNCFLLGLLLSDRELRTPFNIHIIGLACANIINSTGSFLFSWATLFVEAAWTFGEAACSYYLYVYWIEASVVIYQHLLIAVTRLWAVLRPISYRERYTKRLARGLILGIWVWVHAIMLPFLIRDGLYFRRTIRENLQRCRANEAAQWTYNVVGQVIVYLLPIFLQIIIFPAVYLARLAKARRRTVAPSNQEHQRSYRQASSQRGTSGTTLPPESQPNNRPDSASDARRVPATRRPAPGLTFLAIWSLCALVSWVPVNVVIFLLTVHPSLPLPGGGRALFVVFATLVAVQTTIDPIIFLLSVRNLREAARRLATRVFCRPRP
ncbi:hypothetical protein BV898_08553 [Hypsibius exemplaris]|uniref:G-protein coupled receptors family 1 profile domain-containing protein n=1 Tax=Hypsibius exemplaris TaxID=2072580 RepID=A0A1W0WQ71_HYPEX|nr:hypothetical protein BV898_08553 [Hypsibius exemplaris]